MLLNFTEKLTLSLSCASGLLQAKEVILPTRQTTQKYIRQGIIFILKKCHRMRKNNGKNDMRGARPRKMALTQVKVFPAESPGGGLRIRTPRFPLRMEEKPEMG